MNPANYFDYAAATPLSKSARQAMEPYLDEQFYNPSSNYLPAVKVKQAINQARIDIAKLLGARPAEVVFTAGGTESCNLALSGVLERFPDGGLVTSAIEHAAVDETAEHWEATGRDVKRVAVNQRGQLKLAELARAIDDHTVLVSVIHSHNEIGIIQNLGQIAGIIADVRKSRAKNGNELPIFLHSDACQSANYLDLHVKRLGVDLLSINSAKVFGPKQVGALFVRAGIELAPLVYGGGQERGVRGGTENPAGIVGFAEALNHAQRQRLKTTDHARKLKRTFISELESTKLDFNINSSDKGSLPSIVSLSLPGLDGEQLVMALDQSGFAVATGAACSEDAGGPSKSLLAIGLDESTASGTLRISFGPANTEASVKALVAAIVHAVGLVSKLQTQA